MITAKEARRIATESLSKEEQEIKDKFLDSIEYHIKEKMMDGKFSLDYNCTQKFKAPALLLIDIKIRMNVFTELKRLGYKVQEIGTSYSRFQIEW